MTTPTKKKNLCGPVKALVVILAVITLLLLLALFSREQTVKSLKDEKAALKQTNSELQQTLGDGQKMSLAQRLGTAGIDTLNLWKFENEGCQEPYCRLTRVEIEGVEDFVEMKKGLERWKGYTMTFVTPSEDTEVSKAEGSSCEAFAIEGGAVVPINTELLADVEKKLLRAGTEKKQIEITVFETEYDTISCDTPAHVLNVHPE